MTTAVKYVHLPTEVEAEQWLPGSDVQRAYNALPMAWRKSGALRLTDDGTLIVITGRVEVEVEVGDYIVRGGWREFWLNSEAVFLISYQPKPVAKGAGS